MAALTDDQLDRLEETRRAVVAIERSLAVLQQWGGLDDEEEDTAHRPVVVNTTDALYRDWFGLWRMLHGGGQQHGDAMRAWQRFRQHAKAKWRESLGSDVCVACFEPVPEPEQEERGCGHQVSIKKQYPTSPVGQVLTQTKRTVHRYINAVC